jgi:prepilin-type N-terminal cleavage/methylation domain-containing protein
MNTLKQKGFTLVEIAIVLVIVGLLIGGVLKGQEMITNAKLKRIESDNAGILAGLYSYQDRYLQLPGDDDGASGRFTAYTAVNANGDGNGNIEGAWSVATINNAVHGAWELNTVSPPTQETAKFFAHLRASGLIAGGADDAKRPSNAYGGQIGVQNGSLGIGGQVTVFSGIEGRVGSILDGRLDDGAGNTGRLQANVEAAATGIAPMTIGAAGTLAPYVDTSNYSLAFRI